MPTTRQQAKLANDNVATSKRDGVPTAKRKPRAINNNANSDPFAGLPPIASLLTAAPSSWLHHLKRDVKIDDKLRSSVLHTILYAAYEDLGWSAVLNPVFDNRTACKALIAYDIDFAEMLDECIRKHQWQRLVESPTLRKVVEEASTGFPLNRAEAVVNAFESEYLGRAHLVMLQAIDEVTTTNSLYARLLPVVQSSGMGKSRTMHQISKDRIVISICLRHRDSEKTFSYPPSDHAVRDYLIQPYPVNQPEVCKSRIRGLLTCLFQRFAAEIKTWSSSKSMDHLKLVQLTFELFNNSDQQHQLRRSFHESVVKAAVSATSRKKMHLWPSTDLELAWNLLARTLNGACGGASHWPYVILVVDEVHVLYERSNHAVHTHTIYSLLKSVLTELSEQKLCTVALSTTSSISQLAPSKKIAPSQREALPGQNLVVPFTELPFDVHLYKYPLMPGKETLESVGSLEFTVQFGRPLWRSMYGHQLVDTSTPPVDAADGTLPPHENVPFTPEKLCTGMLSAAQCKLSGRSEFKEPLAVLNASSIAILSARLLLDLSPLSDEAQEYQQELVRRHLRIVYSVNENRVTIFTGSSSEPFIAEAAACIMHLEVGQNPYMDAWDLLLRFIRKSLLGQGTIGELIGRTLSIQAMDHAINNLPQVRLRELKYQTPVLVTEYFKALLSKDAWEELRSSVPANGSMLTKRAATKTFEKAFKGSYLHFSHYGEASDSDCLNKNHLWPLWLRGTAIQCRPNQELTDRAAPIHFSHRKTLGPHSMSLILEQDKTGVTADPLSVGIQSAENLGVFGGATDLPYIAVVHCYAASKQGRSSRTTQPKPHNLRAKDENEESPRYQLNLQGLSDYALLDDDLRIRILDAIDHSQGSLVKQHSRRYAVNPMLVLKPYISTKHPVCDWYGDSYGYLNECEDEGWYEDDSVI